MSPFGVFGAPFDAESRPGSPGDSGLVRRGHKKAKNSKKHVRLNFLHICNVQKIIFQFYPEALSTGAD